jgi:hypothetical protein
VSLTSRRKLEVTVRSCYVVVMLGIVLLCGVTKRYRSFEERAVSVFRAVMLLCSRYDPDHQNLRILMYLKLLYLLHLTVA